MHFRLTKFNLGSALLITVIFSVALEAMPRQNNHLSAEGGCQIYQYDPPYAPICLVSGGPTSVQYTGYNNYQPYGYNNYQYPNNNYQTYGYTPGAPYGFTNQTSPTPFPPVQDTPCSWNNTLPQPPSCAQYQSPYSNSYSGYQPYTSPYYQPYGSSYSTYPTYGNDSYYPGTYGNVSYNNYQTSPTPFPPVQQTPCSWNNTLPQSSNCTQYPTGYPSTDPSYQPYPGQNQPIGIGDNFFSPQIITVPVGATVVWANNGIMAHTVSADDNLFDSGTLNPGAAYSFTFAAPGTYGYHCRFHGAPGSGMYGTIIVIDNNQPPGNYYPGGYSNGGTYNYGGAQNTINYYGNSGYPSYQAYYNSVPVTNGQYGTGSYTVPNGFTYVPPSGY